MEQSYTAHRICDGKARTEAEAQIRIGRRGMLRNIPIFAIAMTAGFAAVFFSSVRPLEANSGHAAEVELESEAWFI
jgi:hypothetical protein